MSVQTEKATLRAALRDRRSVFVEGRGIELGDRIADSFLAHAADFGLTAGIRVAGYWPMADEADLRPLLVRLDALGAVCLLPVVVAAGQPLVFRRWRPGLTLDAGPHGTRQPPDTAGAMTPSLLLVPLLAFDHWGWRLGQGGGYYDRTLTALRGRGEVCAVGIGLSCQEMGEVPREATDARLDWLVTEEKAFKAEQV